MALRHRIGARPIRVAAARRMAGDVEQILRRKGQSGQRAAGAALDAKFLPRDERADIVTARASVVCHLRPPLNTSWPGLSRPSTWIPGTSPGDKGIAGSSDEFYPVRTGCDCACDEWRKAPRDRSK